MWYELSDLLHATLEETEAALEDIANEANVQHFERVFVITIVDKCICCKHP